MQVLNPPPTFVCVNNDWTLICDSFKILFTPGLIFCLVQIVGSAKGIQSCVHYYSSTLITLILLKFSPVLFTAHP